MSLYPNIRLGKANSYQNLVGFSRSEARCRPVWAGWWDPSARLPTWPGAGQHRGSRLVSSAGMRAASPSQRSRGLLASLPSRKALLRFAVKLSKTEIRTGSPPICSHVALPLELPRACPSPVDFSLALLLLLPFFFLKFKSGWNRKRGAEACFLRQAQVPGGRAALCSSSETLRLCCLKQCAELEHAPVRKPGSTSGWWEAGLAQDPSFPSPSAPLTLLAPSWKTMEGTCTSPTASQPRASATKRDVFAWHTDSCQPKPGSRRQNYIS